MGSRIEFTLDGSSFHLYAFSNRLGGKVLGNEAVLFSDSNYLMVDNDPLINLTAPAVFFVGRFSDKASSDEGDENSTLVSWAGYPGLSRGWRIYGNPSDYFEPRCLYLRGCQLWFQF